MSLRRPPWEYPRTAVQSAPAWLSIYHDFYTRAVPLTEREAIAISDAQDWPEWGGDADRELWAQGFEGYSLEHIATKIGLPLGTQADRMRLDEAGPGVLGAPRYSKRAPR